ncbi:EAL domain-containing protein [Bradyrhizobium sp. U87765 SZCCT0131]|uniref:putative bifunctional diguanylate cyclase/phosphodiesterase n=1 Tax=unclassified Bradyrhizobium TaxID=2631580 RepID=UPI001BAAA54D|nr:MULTISPECIES: EAL domain-containing protein [unclassified Bradyrhizobium]MBR1220806.1 EAL domain-containing protein [Bradyrhizobium sp. U87765 SZCCT0131]MBR1260374.1 EAL domain-containing protein [Bradyrhizobium sp. U87765 SZCCT0134]MBR1307377.1 EAL domain-containing protein [Bradyrhizobium sp. U87765 SZCCT0110]MBR1321331.1 EAL domain-containing protein [Bradyrhizobium sp. U87765 SZCCT0109]MBR1349644.1 EAL domain-containing protein [Bradyrhizobium sp. U87765 SZCCT0048]
MQLAELKNVPSEKTLTPAIYAALVDSLFQNSVAMFAGALCAAIAAVMTAYKTGNNLLWPCALLIIAVGTFRAFDMQKYAQRTTPLDPSSAESWEKRYQIGAGLYACALGVWCLVVLLGSDDPVAHMLCTAVTVAYTAAGSGRNYGRPGIAQLQIILACGPMSLALLLHGDVYYVGFAFLNLLFFIGLRRITLSLQQVYVKALVASERVTSIADQFDTALNNMPNGLCMFGADGRLAVMNNCFTDMLRVSSDLVHRGASVRELAAACMIAKTLSAPSANALVTEIEASRAGNITTFDPGNTPERALEWTVQPMAAGGTVVLVEDITERRNAEARINHMARFDELTGLPNRLNFRNEIQRLLSIPSAEGSHALSALLFVDLDQFKQVNDTLGHPCGDRLLCAVADRLREMLRPDDFVARFGGDEFVVFQPRIKSIDDAATLARRIVDRLSEGYEIDQHLVEIGASIGIATTSSSGANVDVLLKNADMALYRAKGDGRGTFCFFREEMAQIVETRRTLELELRHALANEEFELFYQPLVNLKTGRIATCEALLRWNHPERGFVPPSDIIPVAEDMGLIVDLGRWILRKACMECMQWPSAVSVAVNFSSQQFHRRDVLSDVRYALEVSGLPANRLEIEITESSLLRNTQWTLDVLAQLRAAGVRISLDDFGTGYSSLSYLNNFPLQKVKIDRSFLEGIDKDRPLTLLRGVARLSADLGMSVVVEGVETNDQLELIGIEGTITEAQGYLFSPPVPAHQIRQLLNASHGRRPKEAPLEADGSRSLA